MAGVVVLLRSAGKVDVDVTRAGGGFEIEVGVGGEAELDAAGAGPEIGCACEVTFGLDVAGAGPRGKGSVEAVDLMVPEPVLAFTSPEPVSSSSISPEPVPSSVGPLTPWARTSPEPLDAER